jgi:multicomponent Na+:H+ antiporter subunit E
LSQKLALGASLFALWLLLSGHYGPLLLSVGLLSVALVVTITARMQAVDPALTRCSIRAWRYWPWLALEVVKANIDVGRRILAPRMDISPRFFRLKAGQKTDLGKVIYANSITLTPGTVTVDVSGEELLVHALTREAAAALEEGEMDRRVRELEGS